MHSIALFFRSHLLALFSAIVLPLYAAGQTLQFTPVSREVIEQRMRRVAKKNAERAVILKAMFEEAGCTGGRLSEQHVRTSNPPNIICVLPGSGDSVMVVGAHFDHTAKGDGAVDNWSGASLLPSLFQSLSVSPRQHTFVFIGFTDEEKGLVGSKYYVKQLSKEETAKLKAMINLDTLGLSGTKVWLSHSNQALANALLRVAHALQLPLDAVNVERVGSSDAQSFANKVPVITIHSLTQETLPILHSDRDTLDKLRLNDYYNTYRVLVAYLAYLDGALPSLKLGSGD